MFPEIFLFAIIPFNLRAYPEVPAGITPGVPPKKLHFLEFLHGDYEEFFQELLCIFLLEILMGFNQDFHLGFLPDLL